MPETFPTSPTALVTGATSGLGFALTRRLVDDGATVIMHAPDRASGERALEDLVKDGAEPLRLRLLVADFTDMAEIATLAAELARTVPTLDLLVNNAAIAGPERRTRTDAGHELTLQVNYLAPYLLTKALTGALAAARGRVVNISSELHHGGSIAWKDLDRKQGYYLPLPVYAQSKLALTMFSRTLAEAHGDALTAVSVDPGAMTTGMLRLYGHVGRPADEVAAEIAPLCDTRTEVIDGGHYLLGVPAKPAALVENPGVRARLARLTARLTEVH
ncbi:SDR family NAD(P)-dependent oxidoreductase [Nocardia sp. CDC159]|uniref:SDR family NAD(P)-dependent oxidoreductase n=1 Tax=Nocardia pulmonis TaxID=2951408 RepID=A0A9X2E3F6_9NOCA|nr:MULTISPECIES: SDR family NAD(P)-dependent oxidoreductase [Nocardia]MCM6773432.1 SDR family NAD(P)-dependent oxidoreductase [Nocardia pulmonis]MCM6786319.1 SDR family NAD(P)-dependent oxidoreductase [Nocardia sp. CDC159]